MSDTPPGEGYWRASDGKWYPPEQAPGGPTEQGWDPKQLSGGRQRGGDYVIGGLARFLVVGSVIALVYGTANASGSVQIGGENGFILDGWQIMLGAALMLLGALGLIWGRKVAGGFNWRLIISLILIGSAGFVWIGLGKTPNEFAAQASYCSFVLPDDGTQTAADMERLRQLAPSEISRSVAVIADALSEDGEAALDNPTDQLQAAVDDVLAYDLDNCPTDDAAADYCLASQLALGDDSFDDEDFRRWVRLAPDEISGSVAVVGDALIKDGEAAFDNPTDQFQAAVNDLLAYNEENCP